MANLPVSGIRLQADNAQIFLRQLAAAESAIDSFRKTASRPTPFAGPDTRSAVATFNSLVEQASQAGMKAGGGLSTGFESGLSPLQTIAQGALLKVGSLAVDLVTDLFSKAGQAASTAWNDALNFDKSIDEISSLSDYGVAGANAVGAAVGAIATDPKLIASTESAATAFQQLEKQGVATDDILGGVLRSTVLLQNAAGTSAGNLTELGTAAEVVGQGMALFGVGADQAAELTNTFAAITTNSKFTLNDLNYTLSNSAGAIKALNIPFEDIGALAIATSDSFSSARTQATGLETIIARLSAPSDEAADALDRLGIRAYDANGDFKGLVGLQDELQESFNSGMYTTEAYQKLLTEAFGVAGAQMAVALANGEDLTVAMETLESTSAEAIAAIKTDNAITALGNLGDVAGDLGRRLLQPFVGELTPAIQGFSSLLSSLSGYFDLVGQRIAAALSPVITTLTGQFNTLAASISALTGLSISAPTVIGGATPQFGPQPAPAGGDAFATGGAASDNRAQERITAGQIDASRETSKASKKMGDSLSLLSDILSSQVTQLDEGLSKEGLYQDKPDEKLRQFRAFVKNGDKQFASVADDYRLALQNIGVKPAEDLETFLLQVEELQSSKAIFANPENIKLLIDEEAVKREVEMKELAKKGADNIRAAFGDYVAGLIDNTSAGLAEAGGAGTAPATPEATPADPTAFYDPYELYVKPVQEQQAAQAKQAAQNQQGLLGGLFQQFDVLGEKFGIVTGLFEGFNNLLVGLNDTVQGQDFQAAGVAVSGTLTTVLGALTQITELADIGTTTANLSTFTQTILDSAANFADGIDGEAVAESASGLMATVTGKLTEAVDGANLTGISISYTNYLSKVSGLLVEAVHGFKYDQLGLTLGTLVTRISGQITGALNDPQVGQNLGDAAGNFATTAIGAVKGAFETLGGALAVADENTDAGEITTGISNLITTVVARFTSAINEVKLDDLGTEVSGMVGHIANLFLEAVKGIQYDGIGTEIGTFVGTIVNKFTELISDPQVGIDLGDAVGTFVSGMITAVQGDFTLLSSALTGADDTLDISALTGAIDGIVTGFVDGFVASITRNFANPDTGALEIEIPTINALPLEAIDLSTIVQFTGELPAPVEVDKAKLVSYINELPGIPEVDKAKLVSFINELPPGVEVDKAKLINIINELPGATEVDKAKLVSFINELPAPAEVDQSKLVQFTGALPDAVNIDLGTLVSFTGQDSEGGDVQSGFAPLTEAINLLAPALSGVSIGIGLVDSAFKTAAEPGGGFDQLTQLISSTVDTVAASIAEVDVAAIGGALNGVITSLTGLFVTLSEIPDLAPITASIGGLVTSLLDLGAGLAGSIDGEQVGSDLSTVAGNLVDRLAEGITAVPLDQIGVAAANLVGALAGTFRDAFTVENLSGVGESLGGLVTDIISQLTATLGDPQFGATLGQAFGDFVAGIVQGAAGLIQGLGTGIDSEAVAGIGDALFTFVTSFIGGIADSLKTVKWDTVGQAIYDGISGAIGSLFSGAESLADAVFGIGFTGGQALAEATGLQGAVTPEGIANAGQGVINFFAPIAEKLSTDLSTAFASDNIYTTDAAGAIILSGSNLSGDISGAFAEDSIYPDAIKQGLTNAATGIKSAFDGILGAVTGFWDSLLGALPDWAKGLLGIESAAASPPSPEETAIAGDLANNLATKADVVNLANTVGNSGQIAPSMDIGSTLTEIQQTQANIEAGIYRQQPTYDPAAYAGANSFDGSVIPVVIQNPEVLAPTTNADGRLTAAGQEQAVANLGALATGLVNNLGASLGPALAQAGGQLAGVVGNLQSATQIGPSTADNNSLLSVDVKPVELSPDAVSLLNNYAVAQATAATQSQDTAAQLPTAEAITGLTAAASLLQSVAANQQASVNLASNSLVGGIGTDAAGLGGEYGPPAAALTQAIDANTAALQAQQPIQAQQPVAGLGDVESLVEYGPDTTKLVEEQTKALISNTNSQETATATTSGGGGDTKTNQELKQLSTTVPAAGQKFTVTFNTTANSAVTVNEKFDGLADSASTLADDGFDPLSDTASSVSGSFNILLDKSDKAAESISDLTDAFADDGLTGGITDFTDALDQAVDDINAALEKLGATESGGTGDTPPKPPGTTGASAKGGPAVGKTLVGEQGRELIYNPLQGWSWMTGENGPQFVDLPAGSYVYPNSETESILARSGGSSEKLWASAAGGFTPNADPIFTDPAPGGLDPGTIPIGDDGIQKDDAEPTVQAGSFLDNPFVQSLLRQQDGQPTSAIGQAVSQKTGNEFDIDQLVDIFNRPLFGNRYTPASVVVNVQVNNTNSTTSTTNNYNLGGVTTKQTTQGILDQFALLKAAYG